MRSEDLSSSDDEASDEEDVFKVRPMSRDDYPDDYESCFLYRWQEAVKELSSHMRDDALLPVWSPGAQTHSVYDNVDSGVKLPVWHCTLCNAQRPPCAIGRYPHFVH